MEDLSTLSKKQGDTLLALISSPSIREAAKKANVGEVTIYRFLNDDNFQRIYRRVRKFVVMEALAKVQTNLAQAVDVLVSILKDPDTSVGHKIATAKIMLEYSLKSVETEEIMERIEDIENYIKSMKEELNNVRSKKQSKKF